MTVFNRLHVARSGEVPVSAALYWQTVLEWSNLMQWWPSPPPMALLGSELLSGHAIGKFPCTRRVFIDLAKLPPGTDPRLIPEEFEETLLFADDVARVLCYTLAGKPLLGMRNYCAYIEVDELAPNRCRITNSGRVDVPDNVPVEIVSTLMADVYDRAIIHGIGALASSRAAVARVGQ